AQSSGRPFLFLDSGMQMPREDKVPGNWFLSLQGLDACRRLGKLSAEGEKKVLMATSFFDAGFRGTYFACKGLEEAKGSVCGNYITKHKISEFTIDPYLELINKGESETVMANFSIYLAELFLNALTAAGEKATPLPFYCSPFLAEEQFLAKSNFPGGTFHTIVPWAQSLENEAQKLFVKTIREQKNKTANIFHLLGWEAAVASVRLLNEGTLSLANWSFESPRGTVTFHPETQISYAPLYRGMIVSGDDGKCALRIDQRENVTAQEHAMNSVEKEDGNYSGWKNNYFCS
ncbi:MAG TPA: hypothetical protein VFJ43_15765, partial [Bacteroidia bacterium]|nr:hypothetical protein [Bacteroidia bacterium]